MMGSVYIPYAVILSVFIFVYCRKKGEKKGWAGVALMLPPAACFVFLKAEPKKKMVAGMVVLSCCLAICGEAYLFFSHGNSKADDTVPPIIKQMISLNEDVKKTTIDIYNASAELDRLSMSQSRIADIRSTMAVIRMIRDLAEENRKAVERLILFADEHNVYFHRKNLAWIFAIKSFYTDDHMIRHRKSRTDYLSAFERLLTYTHENFQNIMELKSQRHIKNYDAYYMLYRRAADSHNRFSRKRVDFQHQFVQEYPEVKPFLPGPHHLEPFQFWDKFSF